MKRISLFLLAVTIAASAFSQQWLQRFQHPDQAARPWTFWYWMYGCVSDEGIVRDLNAMRDAGIGGFYLMPIRGVEDKSEFHGDSEQLSANWWKRVDTAFHIADSLGLQAGIHFCDGFAIGGGPWITPEESMQKIVWCDTVVDGERLKLQLSKPQYNENYYEDVALFAYPADNIDTRKPSVSVSFPFKSDTACSLTMTYPSPFTLRSVKIITKGNNYEAHRFAIYASDNGKDYHFVKQLAPARQGWQNTDADATYSVTATTARYFRFSWTPASSEAGSEDMDAAKWRPSLKVADIVLSSLPVIDGYEGKAAYAWRVSASDTSYHSDCIPMSRFVSLTSALHGDMLTAKLGKGRWHILRIGHTSTAHTNATGGGAKGLECDKFSVSAIDKQFNHWFGTIYNHLPKDVAQRVLRVFHVDSWECGCQNWSRNFAAEFKSRRGYDLMSWLPVYTGVPMVSAERSEQVLRDIRLTISELLNDVFFREVSMLSHQHGCEFSAESVAPTMVSDGMSHYQYADIPMGEYWLNSPTHDKPNDMLDAVSGAHIYGKNIVQAEGFTEVRGTWDEHPAMLKKLLDLNYCVGMNKLVFHVNVHNPWPDRRPGMTLDGIGTFFQRDNTWWREMRSFTDYIARCQSLLQYGSPVVDIAAYTGSESPRRSILPERLMPSLPGLFGNELILRQTARMRNEGCPLTVSPVGVVHQKYIVDPSLWVNPLHGYAYDSFNEDVLMRSTVRNGCLVTPSGMVYRVLVIPQSRPMNPDRLVNWKRVDELRSVGVTVIDKPWMKSDLLSLGVQRDIELPEGVDYVHRHAQDADIYFLSNQTDTVINFIPRFRVVGNVTYCDALTGDVYTSADVTLQPHGSVFAVISDYHTVSKAPFRGISSQPLVTKSPFRVTFEENGRLVASDTLFDWSKSSDAFVKYYSGHAVYDVTFIYGKTVAGGRVYLNLGKVENIATVTLNGKVCGTVWQAPYRVDITHALKRGANVLSVTVVNTWANALLGADIGMPPYRGIWTNGKYRRADKTLLPAGLLGPLNIEVSKTE